MCSDMLRMGSPSTAARERGRDDPVFQGPLEGGSLFTAGRCGRGPESPREVEPARLPRASRRPSLPVLPARGEGCQPSELKECGKGSPMLAEAARADLRRAAELPPAPLVPRGDEGGASECGLCRPPRSPFRPAWTCPSTCPWPCSSPGPCRDPAGRAAHRLDVVGCPAPDPRSPLRPRLKAGSRLAQERRRHALFVKSGLMLQEARTRASLGAGPPDPSWHSLDLAA
jgi:hypothetical protein